jgi:hypothetical protein
MSSIALCGLLEVGELLARASVPSRTDPWLEHPLLGELRLHAPNLSLERWTLDSPALRFDFQTTA